MCKLIHGDRSQSGQPHNMLPLRLGLHFLGADAATVVQDTMLAGVELLTGLMEEAPLLEGRRQTALLTQALTPNAAAVAQALAETLRHCLQGGEPCCSAPRWSLCRTHPQARAALDVQMCLHAVTLLLRYAQAWVCLCRG